MRKAIDEEAMARSNKNISPNTELSHINLEKYTPLINSPCIRCCLDCNPISCEALTDYALRPF